MLCVSVSGQTETCTDGFADPVNFSDEGVDFALPPVEGGSQGSPGYQVIIPEMEFKCHGYISSWSGMAAVEARFIKPTSPITLSHQIYFQLWRPVGVGRYERVDDDYLKFSALEIDSRVSLTISMQEDIAYLNFTGKVGESESRTYFQPGDVLGYFFPSTVGSADRATPPVSVTFRNTVSSDEQTVDVYIVPSEEQLCEISLCGESLNITHAVVPQISVSYGENLCVCGGDTFCQERPLFVCGCV